MTSRYRGLSAAIVAALLGTTHFNYADTPSKKLRKPGKTYPHSSARQRARYARQLAAGQLKFL